MRVGEVWARAGKMKRSGVMLSIPGDGPEGRKEGGREGGRERDREGERKWERKRKGEGETDRHIPKYLAMSLGTD
jgi:hypothetical protein